MGKNKFRPRSIGAPPEMGVPPMPPGVPAVPMPPGIQAPPGSSITEMPEIAGLKFRLTKMDEQSLSLQEEKLAADEQIVKLMKENLDLRKQITALKAKAVYDEVGIDLGDSVSLRDGKYYKVRPPKAPAPPPKAPAPKPPDLKLVRDENGKETMVPKEPDPSPPAPEPPTPEKK